MEETVYLNDKGVTVTSTRIELGGQTFATRNVGSVKLERRGTNWVGIILALLGAAACARGGEAAAGGAVLVIVGAGWAWWSAKRCKLHLIAGGGEVMALKSNDPPTMERIRAAIVQAISAR